MRLLVIGSGAREHALLWKLRQSPACQALFCTPGNAGTVSLATNLPISATDTPALRQAVTDHAIDLVVVGPEAPLAAGLSDALRHDGVRVFGPSQVAARLETSKAWAKQLLREQNIPTARAQDVGSRGEAERALRERGYPCVIKADGLASGKGVWVVTTWNEADEALRKLFDERSLGEAGDRVLIEECLRGPEISLLAFTDGERLAVMPPARDYKRLGDGDVGPNTGGMGGYSRPPDVTPALVDEIEKTILQPTLAAMRASGTPFQGVLYAGLMLTNDGARVLEFNARFGDPECELLLPLLESDLLDTLLSCAEGHLDPTTLFWNVGASCGVVLAAGGYPDAPRAGATVYGLDALPPNILAFHGGTARGANGSVLVAGGRVITLVAADSTLAAARQRLYQHVSRVGFEGVQFRHDIGLVPTPDGILIP